MADASLLAPLWITGGAAVVFFPGIMIAYRAIVVRQRLADIETSLWTESAISTYIRLFSATTADKWKQSLLARHKDRAKAEEAFGSIASNEFLVVHSWGNYLLSVVPVTVVVGAVVWACCAWAHARLVGSNATIGKLDEAFIMAMAGAYVWSVYEMMSRFRSRDLTPEDLLEMMLRHLAAVPIGYAFSLLAIDRVAASMAFVSAAFPLRETRSIFRLIALKKLGQSQQDSERSNEGKLGKVLDGISDLTVIRLEELQIVTYMDLAYMNPIRLIARTGYSLRHVLSWVDQALLVVYVPALKLKLTNVGLPCALDVREFYLDHFYDVVDGRDRDWKQDEAVLELAKATGMPALFLNESFKRVYSDPHVGFLANVWYDQTKPEDSA